MDLAKLGDYHVWANDRARDILRNLAEEELSREVVPPFGSIRRLVAHIVMALEFNRLRRVEGLEVDPYEMDERLSRLPLGELLDRWSEADLSLRDFATTRLDHLAVFPDFMGEGEMTVGHDDYFVQYLVHTAHHRAQIMSAMRMLGREGIGTDYLFYLSYLKTTRESPPKAG